MQKPKRPELIKDQSRMRKFYEHVAKTKGDMDDYWAPGFFQSLLIEKIYKILNDVHGKRIIDVGCGDGRTVIYLAKQKYSVVGIDISYTRLTRAKQKAQKYIGHTLFVQSYAEDFPIKGKVFDGAVCTEVLEHVIDEDALLRGLSHVLKPHAWVLMSIPTVSLSRYFEMRHRKQLIYFDPVEHVREFSYVKVPPFEDDFILIRDLEKKLKKFGFTINKRYGVGFELPLGILRFRVGRFFEKLFRNKGVNRFIMKLPFLKNFGMYIILILQKVQLKSFTDPLVKP